MAKKSKTIKEEVRKRDNKFVYENENGEITRERALELLKEVFEVNEDIAETNLNIAEMASVRDDKPKAFDKDGIILSVKQNK